MQATPTRRVVRRFLGSRSTRETVRRLISAHR